jgi:hypothetical protein
MEKRSSLVDVSDGRLNRLADRVVLALQIIAAACRETSIVSISFRRRVDVSLLFRGDWGSLMPRIMTFGWATGAAAAAACATQTPNVASIYWIADSCCADVQRPPPGRRVTPFPYGGAARVRCWSHGQHR